MLYMTMSARIFDTVSEYLAFETYGLAEYVTPETLQALKGGTRPIAEIAESYMADIDHDRIRTGEAETRADLLSWISSEINASREMDKWAAADEQMFARLAEIRAFAENKKAVETRMQARLLEMLAEAYTTGPSKGALAEAAMISRPTLDAWLAAASSEIAGAS